MHVPQPSVPISVEGVARFTSHTCVLHQTHEYGVPGDAPKQNCGETDGTNYCA